MAIFPLAVPTVSAALLVMLTVLVLPDSAPNEIGTAAVETSEPELIVIVPAESTLMPGAVPPNVTAPGLVMETVERLVSNIAAEDRSVPTLTAPPVLKVTEPKLEYVPPIPVVATPKLFLPGSKNASVDPAPPLIVVLFTRLAVSKVTALDVLEAVTAELAVMPLTSVTLIEPALRPVKVPLAGAVVPPPLGPIKNGVVPPEVKVRLFRLAVSRLGSETDRPLPPESVRSLVAVEPRATPEVFTVSKPAALTSAVFPIEPLADIVKADWPFGTVVVVGPNVTTCEPVKVSSTMPPTVFAERGIAATVLVLAPRLITLPAVICTTPPALEVDVDIPDGRSALKLPPVSMVTLLIPPASTDANGFKVEVPSTIPLLALSVSEPPASMVVTPMEPAVPVRVSSPVLFEMLTALAEIVPATPFTVEAPKPIVNGFEPPEFRLRRLVAVRLSGTPPGPITKSPLPPFNVKELIDDGVPNVLTVSSPAVVTEMVPPGWTLESLKFSGAGALAETALLRVTA